MADSAMVSAYFFAQKIEDFHPRFSGGVFKHPLQTVEEPDFASSKNRVLLHIYGIYEKNE